MSLPRKSTRNGTRGYAHLVEVDVPVARVWRALTDPGLIRIWSGQEAEIDPRKGGSYLLGNRNAGGREGVGGQASSFSDPATACWLVLLPDGSGLSCAVGWAVPQPTTRARSARAIRGSGRFTPVP